MEDYEEYEEVDTESYDEDLTGSDVVFLGSVCLGGCVVLTFLMCLIKRTFKNVHVKVGNKLEIGVETKDSGRADKKEE